MKGAVVVDAPQQLAVVSQDYVRLPFSILAVGVGYKVAGIDPERSRISHLRYGELYQGANRVPLLAGNPNMADAVILAAEHDELDCWPAEHEARWIFNCHNRFSGVNVEFL